MSDPKDQSAPNQHGHQVEHGTWHARGGGGRPNTREMDQNNVEVKVEVAVPGISVLLRRRVSFTATVRFERSTAIQQSSRFKYESFPHVR